MLQIVLELNALEWELGMRAVRGIIFYVQKTPKTPIGLNIITNTSKKPTKSRPTRKNVKQTNNSLQNIVTIDIKVKT